MRGSHADRGSRQGRVRRELADAERAGTKEGASGEVTAPNPLAASWNGTAPVPAGARRIHVGGAKMIRGNSREAGRDEESSHRVTR